MALWRYLASMYEFDEDTRVTRIAEGTYSARISERWSIGHVPNGGYVLAVVASALADALAAPDPLAVTAHFLRPALASDAEIEIELVKLGKSFTTAQARLVQDGSERLRALATYGTLAIGCGPSYVDGAPPDLPALDAAVAERPDALLPEIARRFEQRLDPETLRWMQGERREPAEIRGLVRFADGRPPDAHSLLLFADALPPPAFNVITPGWLPTLELSVHVRARPVPGFLRVLFRTRFLFGGLLEEDGELWDESGTLVALSRQLAAMPRER
jgi:acyl-CoA thioesterase